MTNPNPTAARQAEVRPPRKQIIGIIRNALAAYAAPPELGYKAREKQRIEYAEMATDAILEVLAPAPVAGGGVDGLISQIEEMASQVGATFVRDERKISIFLEAASPPSEWRPSTGQSTALESGRSPTAIADDELQPKGCPFKDPRKGGCSYPHCEC